MKIGNFSSLYPYPQSFTDSDFYKRYPIGGAENWAYYSAREMAKLGHEVFVFTASVDSRNHVEEEDGINIYRFGTKFKIGKAPFSCDLFTQSLKHDVDVIDIHFSTPPGILAGWSYARRKNKPYIVSYHGEILPNYGNVIRRIGLTLFDRYVVDKVLSDSTLIIARSKQYINLSKFLQSHQEKTEVLPYAIHTERCQALCSKEECREKLSLPKDSKIILFIGVLINYKSPDLLIQAMPSIIKANPDAKLVIVGDGPLRGDLQHLAGDLHIAQAIKLVGAVPPNLTPLYYGAADIFCLPSTGRTESFGIVLLEAAAAGLPIVVSSLDTFRAFIRDGYNGLIAQMGDTDSLARVINHLLADQELRRKLGANAKERVKEYSWENIAKKVENIYLRVLEKD
ncbi:MAG: glycosyltransferase family 4 protein [Dehalococcoidales bacterium]|nr:glycosyltransferase family 4 protein [Dehalococcoidales bacterium]